MKINLRTLIVFLVLALIFSLLLISFPTPKIDYKEGWIFYETPSAVRSLEFDADGYLWVGCIGGVLIKLDLTSGERFVYNFDDMSNIDYIGFGKTKDMWIGGNHSFIRSNYQGEWVVHPAVSPAFIAPDGILWATGSNYATVEKFDGQFWETYQINSDDDTMIISLTVDAEGNIWVSLEQGFFEGQEDNKGVWMFDGSAWKEDPELSESYYHYKILPSANGSLWFVAPKVIGEDTKPGRIKKLVDGEWTLNVRNVEDTIVIELDANEELWAISDLLNVLKFNGAGWEKKFSSRELMDLFSIEMRGAMHIYSIAFHNTNKICLGTDLGVFCKDGYD